MNARHEEGMQDIQASKDEYKRESIRWVLKKYLLPDCLRPEYDGMSTHELAGIILREIRNADEAQTASLRD